MSVLSSHFHDCVPELIHGLDYSCKQRLCQTRSAPKSTRLCIRSVFTGCAQVQSRCELCMSMAYSTKQCVLATDPDPELPARIKAIESAVVSLAAQQSSNLKAHCPPSLEVRRLLNENHCCFPKCGYLLEVWQESPGSFVHSGHGPDCSAIRPSEPQGCVTPLLTELY